MQKLADRGLQNMKSQLIDLSAPPGFIEEWKIGGAVRSVNFHIYSTIVVMTLYQRNCATFNCHHFLSESILVKQKEHVQPYNSNQKCLYFYDA